MSGFVLKADIDKITGFEHLFARLGKTRLVPIHGLQCRKTGNE